MKSSNLIVILVLAVCLYEVTPFTCTHAFEDGITFDLSNLQKLGKLKVVDERQINKGYINRTYLYLNIHS